MKFKWHDLLDSPYQKTERVKVIGGWIVKHRELWDGEGESIAMVFISDPKHEWEVEKD